MSAPGGEGAMDVRQPAQAGAGAGRAALRSVRRRSTSTASTSRRTRRSSAASSRSSSASRRSRIRSRSCAAQGALRGAPRRPDLRTRRSCRGGDARQSLHHRPVPAGQGDRPDRRSGEPARMEIDSMPEPSSTSWSGASCSSQIEREGAESRNGGGRGSQDRLARVRWRRSWPTSTKETSAAMTPAGRKEKEKLAEIARGRHQGAAGCQASSRARDRAAAAATSRRPSRDLNTARSPTSRRSWPKGRRRLAGKAQTVMVEGGGDAPRSDRQRRRAAGPACPSTRCWRASARSCCAWRSELARSASSARRERRDRSVSTPCAGRARG